MLENIKYHQIFKIVIESLYFTLLYQWANTFNKDSETSYIFIIVASKNAHIRYQTITFTFNHPHFWISLADICDLLTLLKSMLMLKFGFT